MKFGRHRGRDDEVSWSGDRPGETSGQEEATGGALGGECNHKGALIEESRTRTGKTLVVVYRCQRCRGTSTEYR